MSRKSSSSGGSNAYINESKHGGSGYFSQVKSETGSSDIARAYDDIGNDTKQTSSRGDNDAMTVHRRKMMRRAANRRSAQLSRARKKTHMQELQSENARLHRLLDIFDSNPDYMFCCTRDGGVTFLSARLMFAIGASCPEEVNHINNMMKQESVDTVFDYINQLNKSYNQNLSIGSMSVDAQHCDNLVKEVFLFDGDSIAKSAARNGVEGPQYIHGYMRISRIDRKPPQLVDMENVYSAETSPRGAQAPEATRTGNRSSSALANSTTSPTKRQRQILERDNYASAKSLEDAAAVLSALTGMANGTMGNLESKDSSEDKLNAMTSDFASSTELYSNDSSPRHFATAALPVRELQSASTSASVSMNNLHEAAVVGERTTSGRRRAASNAARGALLSQHSGSSECMDDSVSASASMELGAGSHVVPLHEEEYVVVIRPVDVSVAFSSLGTRVPITFLSKDTIVKHNKQQKDGGDVVMTRKRSQSSSSGSGDGFDTSSNTSSSGNNNSGLTSKQSSSGSNVDSRAHSEDGMNDSNSSNDND